MTARTDLRPHLNVVDHHAAGLVPRRSPFPGQLRLRSVPLGDPQEGFPVEWALNDEFDQPDQPGHPEPSSAR
jgi:hypothetical protein